MKKTNIFLSSLVLLGTIVCGGFLANAGTSNSPCPTVQNYCPPNRVCVATNMTAKGFEQASHQPLSGIAVYKDGSNVIAQVPGHGSLSCYWSSAGATGWHFRANGGFYVIENLGKDI